MDIAQLESFIKDGEQLKTDWADWRQAEDFQAAVKAVEANYRELVIKKLSASDNVKHIRSSAVAAETLKVSFAGN